MRRRRIAVVTGARAEYGLLLPVLQRIRRDPRLRLQLVVTGQHLLPAFGRTVREIRRDGLPIAARVPLGLGRDRPLDVALAVGRGVLGFARVLARLKPDILVLLGDRYEILAAAAAALALRVPVAHIHGGEATEGVIDEQVRHAVTKLSHLHFPAAEPYRRRILQMGEDPRRVHCFGAPGAENIRRVPPLTRGALLSSLGIPPSTRVGVATYHPATLDPRSARREVSEFLAALERAKGLFWILTLPNADAGNQAIARAIRAFARRRPDRAKAFASLGRRRYLSLLRAAEVMAGNSSSGLLEAPSFRLPVVDIGDRQRGRLRPANVIHVSRCRAAEVGRALRRALSPAFRRGLRSLRNPYAGRDTSARIVRVLATAPLGADLLKKSLRAWDRRP